MEPESVFIEFKQAGERGFSKLGAPAVNESGQELNFLLDGLRHMAAEPLSCKKCRNGDERTEVVVMLCTPGLPKQIIVGCVVQKITNFVDI